MSPELLMQLLIIASGATTFVEKARVCWRANDHLWRSLVTSEGAVDLAFARLFNNVLQDQKWPWVRDLWSKAEVAQIRASYGVPAVE